MTELPNLPRQNKKKEADFGVVFRKWIMDNPRIPSTFELKDTRGKNYLLFSELTDKQRAFGMSVKSDRGVLIRVEGLNGEADYSYHRNSPAYVVIRYPKMWAIIDIETFMLEDSKSKRRSLTAVRAKEIATTLVPLA